jgi:hypothetical protein
LHFRHALWELQRATWADLLRKQTEAQEQLREHRRRVAAELGMELTDEGQLVARGNGVEAKAVETSSSSAPSASSGPVGMVPSVFSAALHSASAGAISSGSGASQSVGMSLSNSSSSGSTSSSSTGRPPAAISSSLSLSPRTSPSNFLLSARPQSREAQRQAIIDSAKGAAVAEAEAVAARSTAHSARPPNLSLRLDSRAGIAFSAPPTPSPRAAPLTAASMSACDTAHMGALLSEALALSSAEGGGGGRSVSIGAGISSSAGTSSPVMSSLQPSVKHASSTRGGVVEEKEQVFTFSRAAESSNYWAAAVAPGAAAQSSSPPRPRSAERTQAVTAAAFATISNLVSTPSVPSECTLAYFDVMRRLDMQHANLHQRIRAWAQKQADLQAQSGGRDQVLTRIARHMRSTLLAQMFLRWVEVVVQRKRQQVAWSSLHRRYADSDAHLKARFLSWRIYTLRRRAALTDRVVRDTDARNVVLQSELGELRAIRGREADKRDLLRSKEAALVKERDEIANFLDQCQAQIRSVQGAQITQLISRTIRVLEESIGTLWSELKAARDANLQDPCRMLVSSTVLLEHVSKPYSQMVECSSEWVSARRAEVARSRARFDAMLDADLLLTWVNFHAAEAHLKLNQDKLSAKFYGKNYKYDVAGAYPTHVRNFYSSEVSLQRRAENFTSSLQDCEVLLRLLTQISPHLADVDVLAHVDLEVRGRKTLKLLGLLSPEAASLLSPLDLTHCFAPDLCAALLCRIMMNYPCLGNDNTAFGGDPRRKPKSEYANNNDANNKNSAAAAAQAAQVNKLKAQGLSAQGASRAAALMAEEARIEGRDIIASLDLGSASSNVLPTAASLGLERADTYLAHRDESAVVAQQRERRRSISTAASSLADAATIVPPLAVELDEADAERSVKDCGPFTQLLRALHLVKRELTTRARVEVNLVSHVTASVRKVLTDVRILLDDAYERDALWQSVHRRVAAFSTTILTCQMRGTPLAMPDRQALRQIRRFTKLLDRTGKPQERFMDLLHPWNRTSNDVLMRRTRARKGKAKGGVTSSDSDEEEDDEAKAAKRALRKANKAHKGGEDDDASSSSSSSSSDSDSDNDSDDDDEEQGARTAEGDDLWREHKLLTPAYLSSLSGEESERLLRRARHRGETLEDLQSQATFELAKMQEQLAKHYQSLRDVFRAYAQVAGDSTVEQAFRAREEEKGGGTGAGSAISSVSGGTSTSGLGSTGLSSPGGPSSGAGGTPSGKTSKKERAEVDEDPTASLRRKLRDALAGNSSSSYGSSNAGGLAASLGGLSSSSSSSSSASAAAEAHQAALAHNIPANPQLRYHDFLLFVRDCHILTPHFGVKKVARIFEKVWTRDMRAAMSAAGAGASSDHPLHAHAPPLLQSMRDRARMEIDCRQFVEVLIRIAHQRMPGPREREELLAELECDREAEAERKRAEGGGGPAAGATTAGPNGPTDVAEHAARQMDALTRASISVGQTGPSNATTAGASAASNPAFEFGTPLFPSTRLGLALRLFGLVRCKIMPSAARLSIDAFRAQYKRIEVSVLYKKHGAVLRKLFHRYAKIHAVRGKAHVQVAAAAAAAAQAQAASAAAAASVDGADSATISAAEDAAAAASIAAGAAASAASEAVWTNAIDAKELVQLLRDSKILDGRVLTLSQLYAICANVQTDLAKVPALPQLPQDEKKEGAGSGLQQSAREIRAEAAAKARTTNAARRRSGQKKLELPGLAATAAASSPSAVASSSVSAAASNTVSPDVSQGPSLAASRRASLQTGGEWGSGSSSRNAAAAGLSLQDLNLEAQAAAASAAPSDEQILSQHSSASGGGGHTALLFAEFLEALAAVAAVKHPFPYRPLHVRLQHFLERDLLPWIQITQANNKE